MEKKKHAYFQFCNEMQSLKKKNLNSQEKRKVGSFGMGLKQAFNLNFNHVKL
jgi:hypothetical protein